jgi:hypothetical protein
MPCIQRPSERFTSQPTSYIYMKFSIESDYTSFIVNLIQAELLSHVNVYIPVNIGTKM